LRSDIKTVQGEGIGCQNEARGTGRAPAWAGERLREKNLMEVHRNYCPGKVRKEQRETCAFAAGD